MATVKDLVDDRQIQALCLRACRALDQFDENDFCRLFTINATYSTGGTIYHGRAEIKGFASTRKRRPVRHLPSPTLISVSDDGVVSGISTCLLIGADPITVLKVADFEDIYEMENNAWRIARRHVVRSFEHTS